MSQVKAGCPQRAGEVESASVSGVPPTIGAGKEAAAPPAPPPPGEVVIELPPVPPVLVEVVVEVSPSSPQAAVTSVIERASQRVLRIGATNTCFPDRFQAWMSATRRQAR